METWIPGVPAAPEPDRLYAVLQKPQSGYAVGCVIRGEDCNWKSVAILGHYPMPLTMTRAESMALKRSGRSPLAQRD